MNVQTLVGGCSTGINRFSFPVMHGHGPVAFAMAAAPMAESAGGESSSSFDMTIRTYFPETWIWQLAQVGLVKHLLFHVVLEELELDQVPLGLNPKLCQTVALQELSLIPLGLFSQNILRLKVAHNSI